MFDLVDALLHAETGSKMIPLRVSPFEYCATLLFGALCIWASLR